MKPVGEPYKVLEAGAEFWHVYDRKYPPTSFNPFATSRFAAHGANPPRAMFYAGNTPECALWETLLRDIVPSEAPPHDVVLPQPTDRSIARVCVKRKLKVVDLGRPQIRWISGDDHDARDAIISATVDVNYSKTHQIAIEILESLVETCALCWPSKQIDSDQAYVFYDRPVIAADFAPLQTIDLDSLEGYELIDRALMRASLHRVDAVALSKEISIQTLFDFDIKA